MTVVAGQQIIPPDGGYGWVIVFACALKKVIIIPIVFNLGLVLQQAYDELNVSPSEGTKIIMWRYTIEMLLSIFGGPLLRRFGYRKVAIVCSLLVFVSLVLTSTASSFLYFLIYYSILLSIGESQSVPAFDLALNSFFKEKRARAIGIVTFCSALGPMLMPLLMSVLLDSYGWRYTVLTLSALSLHPFLAACLLRPIKWYAKVQPIYEETNNLHPNATVHMTLLDSGNPIPIRKNGFEEGDRVKSLRCLPGELQKNDVSPLLNQATSCPNMINEWQEASLLQPITIQTTIDNSYNVKDMDNDIQDNKNKIKKNVQRMIDFFDLTLLNDPVFVSILFGLCLGPCVEVSFSLMFPIILKDMTQLETSDIAKLMSILAFSDLVFRLLGPYITEPLRKSPRVIYMISLCASIVSRTALHFIKSFNGLICMALAIGATKGINSIYLKVILPDYLSIDRLAYAFGIVKFFRGIINLIIEAIISYLRVTTASYDIPIVVLNILTMITVLMWTTELLYLKMKKRAPEDKIPNDENI